VTYFCAYVGVKGENNAPHDYSEKKKINKAFLGEMEEEQRSVREIESPQNGHGREYCLQSLHYLKAECTIIIILRKISCCLNKGAAETAEKAGNIHDNGAACDYNYFELPARGTKQACPPTQ